MPSGVPSSLPQWASTLTPGGDLTVPTTELTLGWQPGQPRRQYMNWWQQLVYFWILWLSNLEASSYVWTNTHEFQAAVTFDVPIVFTPSSVEPGTGGAAPALGTNWSTVGVLGTPGNGRYYKDLNGDIVLAGNFQNAGSPATTVFTLPVGFRPASARNYVCQIGAGGICQITVTSGGAVQIFGTTPPGIYSFDDVRFNPHF